MKSNFDITPSKTANVLIEKEIREITGETYETIALKYGTSVSYVKNVNYKNMNPEAKKIYRKKKEKLKEIALDTTVTALERGKTLIEEADHPKYLSGIAAMGKLSDTIYRLEEKSPTSIISTNTTETYAIEFFQLLLQEYSFGEALEAFREADLKPILTREQQKLIAEKIEKGELNVLETEEETDYSTKE